MMKKKLYIFALSFCLLCSSIFLGGCSSPKDQISKTDFYFDTVITITLYDAAYEKELEHCFSMAAKYENLFSAQKGNTEIWQINHSNGKPVTVSDETIALLEAGIEYSKKSNGTFDITVGKLSSLWDFSENSAKHLPSEDEIAAALATIDYHNVIIDGNTVTLTNPDAAIDLGGIAKGYIADQMKAYLNKQGITSGLINLGGNVLCVGPKTGEEKTYTIAIQKPFSEDGTVLATVKVSDASVVTSGTYQRYFEVNGKRYHHILDLTTGYPCNNTLDSVTIISKKSVDCDALSTTVFLMGLDDGLSYVENLSGVEAIFVTTSGDIKYTSGIGKTIPFEQR